MTSTRSCWDQHHDMNRMYFCFDADFTAHNLKKTNQHGSGSLGLESRMFGSCSSHRPTHPCVKSSDHTKLDLLSSHSHPEGDQVVPSFQKLSVYEQTPSCSAQRSSKPLPPLPDMEDESSDEAADSEVEFFSSTSESQLLVCDRGSRHPALRYGMLGRRSFRGCGQINYAYRDSLREQSDASGPKAEKEQLRDGPKQQERPQRKLRRSHSGPAGAFKLPSLRKAGLDPPASGRHQEKPEVPPRVPMCSRPKKSTGEQHTDQPPEIPPRQPIFYSLQRAPSPKSLPIYVNGVMPPTQSFAPNPKYVSKAQHRQTCEGVPGSRSPCILPIMEDGKKASATHYFLLPQRPGYLDKFERFFKESDSEAVHSGC